MLQSLSSISPISVHSYRRKGTKYSCLGGEIETFGLYRIARYHIARSQGWLSYSLPFLVHFAVRQQSLALELCSECRLLPTSIRSAACRNNCSVLWPDSLILRNRPFILMARALSMLRVSSRNCPTTPESGGSTVTVLVLGVEKQRCPSRCECLSAWPCSFSFTTSCSYQRRRTVSSASLPWDRRRDAQWLAIPASRVSRISRAARRCVWSHISPAQDSLSS